MLKSQESDVTAEPLPSRLAAIARGTGEVDCVRILDVLIAQERLMRFEELVATLLL